MSSMYGISRFPIPTTGKCLEAEPTPFSTSVSPKPKNFIKVLRHVISLYISWVRVFYSLIVVLNTSVLTSFFVFLMTSHSFKAFPSLCGQCREAQATVFRRHAVNARVFSWIKPPNLHPIYIIINYVRQHKFPKHYSFHRNEYQSDMGRLLSLRNRLRLRLLLILTIMITIAITIELSVIDYDYDYMME